jgi:hypothetical protein
VGSWILVSCWRSLDSHYFSDRSHRGRNQARRSVDGCRGANAHGNSGAEPAQTSNPGNFTWERSHTTVQCFRALNWRLPEESASGPFILRSPDRKTSKKNAAAGPFLVCKRKTRRSGDELLRAILLAKFCLVKSPLVKSCSASASGNCTIFAGLNGGEFSPYLRRFAFSQRFLADSFL